MKSKCAPHLPTFAPLFGIVSPLSKSQHHHHQQQQHLGPRPTGAEDCARCWLELTLAASFLAFRSRLWAQALRERHHTHLLTSSTFTSSSFASPVSSSSASLSSSAAALPCCVTEKQARYVDDRWQRPTRRRQPRL